MSTTIHDIAEHLKLSKSTVSKALNGYDDVSVETRELVQQTANRLGYQPTAAARNLRRGRTDKIGLFLNTSIEYVVDYLSGIIPGAVLQSQQFGKNLIIYTMADNDPNALLNACRSGEVDGAILFSTHYNRQMFDALFERNFPFVVMGREIPDERVSYVVPDYYTGSYMAVQHLVELGHRRIAFMTRPELTTANESRLAGYVDALNDAGITFDDSLVVETRIQPDTGIEPTRKLLQLVDKPTAICAFHDLMAVDVIQVLQAQGYQVPDDISVVGFDGLRAGFLTVPHITTMQQPLAFIGQRVVEIIHEKLNQVEERVIQETVDVELIVRGSTGKVKE